MHLDLNKDFKKPKEPENNPPNDDDSQPNVEPQPVVKPKAVEIKPLTPIQLEMIRKTRELGEKELVEQEKRLEEARKLIEEKKNKKVGKKKKKKR